MRLRLKSSLFLFFAATLLSQPVLSAENHFTPEIEQVAVEISDVYACGRWKNESGTGHYRVLYVDWYHAGSLLYVQWIRDTSPTGFSREIVHTLSISEFNSNDHIELTFPKPTCKRAKDGIAFYIVADSGHDQRKHKFQLHVSSRYGEYVLKELK